MKITENILLQNNLAKEISCARIKINAFRLKDQNSRQKQNENPQE
jgi:hypothetical protein